jgi:hypothetical protein
MGIEDDLPGSRRVIEQAATKFNIYFFCLMAFVSACMFLVGGFMQQGDIAKGIEHVPAPILVMGTGIITFSFCSPLFMALYFARHLLKSIHRLERENTEIRSELTALRDSRVG